MSYHENIDVKELSLRIPKTDFPLKSDCIVGYQQPVFQYCEDEGDYSDTIHFDLLDKKLAEFTAEAI